MQRPLVLSPLEVLAFVEGQEDPGDEQAEPPPDEGGPEQPDR